MSEKNRPAHKIRRGPLTLTIWKNDTENGPMYTVNPSRSYKDGDQWKETTSFHQQDLLVLGKLLDDAETWIAAQRAAARSTEPAQETGYAEDEIERKQAGGRGR